MNAPEAVFVDDDVRVLLDVKELVEVLVEVRVDVDVAVSDADAVAVAAETSSEFNQHSTKQSVLRSQTTHQRM